MQRRKIVRAAHFAAAALLLVPAAGRAQESAANSPAKPGVATTPAAAAAQLDALAGMLQQVEAQVSELKSALAEVRTEAAQARAETIALRHELAASRGQIAGAAAPGGEAQTIAPASPAAGSAPEATAGAAQGQTLEQRVGKLEEDQQLANARLSEQYQTKVESASKYRVRLSGIALLNLFSNRGSVENLDLPTWAVSPGPMDSTGTFGGTLRQSEIGLEAFGPEVAGAKTSAAVQFDFAGGSPATFNGVTNGIVRLRTAVVRLDWARTSVVVGQDNLFIAPFAPSSLASLAVPAMAYAGKLWTWTPQLRIEHRLSISEGSSIQFQGGILDGLTGEFPANSYFRGSQAGERAAQPAYATRVAWNHRMFGRNLTLGAGGYYNRQNWGAGQKVDGWAGTTDWLLPLGQWFDLSGEYYRGRAVGGLGGGIGQSVVFNGAFIGAVPVVNGLNSAGGWGQLKFRPVQRFEINGAFGQDNPYAHDLRRFGGPLIYSAPTLARNRTGLLNFIYRPRSDVLFSAEFRHLRTADILGDTETADVTTLSMGILF